MKVFNPQICKITRLNNILGLCQQNVNLISLLMVQFGNVGTCLISLTGSEHQPGRHVRRRRAKIPATLPLCHEREVVWGHRGTFPGHAPEGATSMTPGHSSLTAAVPPATKPNFFLSASSCCTAPFLPEWPQIRKPNLWRRCRQWSKSLKILVITVIKGNDCSLVCKNIYFTSFKFMALWFFSQLLCGYVWRRSKRLWGMFHQVESDNRYDFIECKVTLSTIYRPVSPSIHPSKMPKLAGCRWEKKTEWSNQNNFKYIHEEHNK